MNKVLKGHQQILYHFVIYALTPFQHVFLVRPGTNLYPYPFQLTEIASLMLCQLLPLAMRMLRLKSKSRHALK